MSYWKHYPSGAQQNIAAETKGPASRASWLAILISGPAASLLVAVMAMVSLGIYPYFKTADAFSKGVETALIFSLFNWLYCIFVVPWAWCVLTFFGVVLKMHKMEKPKLIHYVLSAMGVTITIFLPSVIWADCVYSHLEINHNVNFEPRLSFNLGALMGSASVGIPAGIALMSIHIETLFAKRHRRSRRAK